jgi:phytoene dehydrogenase-like protein
VRHFEVVVVGNEISGLVAGALLAKSGQRVLHLDPWPLRSTYPYRDLTFHRHLRLFSSWDASPAQKRVFFDLNLISEISRRLVPLEPSFQVVLPEHRFDVPRDASELAVELEREYPGSGHQVADALDEVEALNERLDRLLDGSLVLPPETWSERRELTRRLAQDGALDGGGPFGDTPSDHPLVQIAKLPLRFVTHLDPAAESPIRYARAARQIRKGLFALPGGLDELKETLSGVIQHFHGEARQDTIAEVTARWGRITSFRLGSGETVGFDEVIGAATPEMILQLFPDGARKGRYGRVLSRIRPVLRVYTLNLALRPEGVPEGMGPLGFFVRDPARPLVEDNLLLWCLHGSGDLRGLTVACHVPDTPGRPHDGWREIRGRLMRSVETLVPFLGNHLVHLDVPWNDGEAPGDEVRPASEMDDLCAWDGESVLGIAALPHRTPVKNLILANRRILPSLGLEGEFLAGMSAFRLLHRQQKKPAWSDF